MKPVLNPDGSPIYELKPDGQPLLETIMINNIAVLVPVKKMALEVTPNQVDVGANVINLLDQKQGVVVLTTGYIARVHFADGSEKDLHFGRLAPGPGAIGE